MSNHVSQYSPEPAPNPEAQRLLLLQAMGIRSWYPRFQLPGALPSVACAWLPDEPLADATTTQQAAVVTAPAMTAIPAAVEPQRPVPAASPVPELTTPAVHPARATARRQDVTQSRLQAEPATTLTFQVVLLLADKGLAICNQLPALARPGLGRSEQLLLNNMLLWLGCSLQPGSVQRHFSWPLPGLANTDAELAGKGLHSFLAQAQQDSGFTRLLLLGSSSVECLQPHLAGGDLRWQTWCTHSLSEMLALPELKRSAWQQLQTLHAGLR